jgi:MFS family permease
VSTLQKPPPRKHTADKTSRLNFFFAIASTTCNVSALPVGTILDRYGPRVCAVLGSVFLAAGALLMGYAFEFPEYDGFVVANVMLALGGTFVFLPSFQIANAFPKYSGTIVATVTGAFDASAAVFLFYRLAYQSSEGNFSPQKFFFGYLAVPVLIFVAQFTIMSPDNYKTLPELERKLEKAENVYEDVSIPVVFTCVLLLTASRSIRPMMISVMTRSHACAETAANTASLNSQIWTSSSVTEKSVLAVKRTRQPPCKPPASGEPSMASPLSSR